MTFISVHFAATVKNLVPPGDRVYLGEEVRNISHQFRAHSTEACRGGVQTPNHPPCDPTFDCLHGSSFGPNFGVRTIFLYLILILLPASFCCILNSLLHTGCIIRVKINKIHTLLQCKRRPVGIRPNF